MVKKLLMTDLFITFDDARDVQRAKESSVESVVTFTIVIIIIMLSVQENYTFCISKSLMESLKLVFSLLKK